ncbi:OB-fold domain-containing protein [Rhodococcus sp. LB1]|uniref:Zn-ribbon domain-containing OB-fold protein n=1 Tax=Rhodococcus sp. LB1 TaxID=1807499 RepID=UPI0018D4B252
MFCPSCWSTRLAWTESLGVGTIYSYSVVWRAQSPAFDTPCVVAIIEFAEGFHMMSNIVKLRRDRRALRHARDRHASQNARGNDAPLSRAESLNASSKSALCRIEGRRMRSPIECRYGRLVFECARRPMPVLVACRTGAPGSTRGTESRSRGFTHH